MTIIEINLQKLERGTHEGRVKVTRGGKTFWRKQRVGRKEDGDKEVWEKISSDFISDKDTEIKSGSLVPLHTDFKLGDMKLDLLTGQIDILRNVELYDLHYREDISDIINMDIVDQYVKWIKEGSMPPPITVIEDFSGRKETLNRRRVYAMKIAGITTAPAWQFYGNRRHIVKNAIKMGKKVPLNVCKECGIQINGDDNK